MTHRNRGLAIAAAIFILDQVVKALVLGPLGLRVEGDSVYVMPFFSFTLVHNIGVSLGMFNATTDAARWGLVILTSAIGLFVARWLWREKNAIDASGLGLILGGAFGNVIDRVRFGHVTDYADLHFGNFRPFLVFNIADAAITIGVLVLLARALFAKDDVGADGTLADAENK